MILPAFSFPEAHFSSSYILEIGPGPAELIPSPYFPLIVSCYLQISASSGLSEMMEMVYKSVLFSMVATVNMWLFKLH